jgi:hypothetical protein
MLRHFAFFAGSHQTEYCSNYIFIFYYLFFIWCFYIQFLAEWIAIKRPNITCNPISLELTILLLVGFFEYKAIYQHYQGNGLPFQCFPWSTKFYGDANIKLYC